MRGASRRATDRAVAYSARRARTRSPLPHTLANEDAQAQRLFSTILRAGIAGRFLRVVEKAIRKLCRVAPGGGWKSNVRLTSHRRRVGSCFETSPVCSAPGCSRELISRISESVGGMQRAAGIERLDRARRLEGQAGPSSVGVTTIDGQSLRPRPSLPINRHR